MGKRTDADDLEDEQREDRPRSRFDWREVAYTFNGYEAVGVQQCGEIAVRVHEGIGAAGTLEGFSIDELRIALFFSARTERHTGDASLVSPVEEAIVAELLRRKGEAWLWNELSHRVLPPSDATLNALTSEATDEEVYQVLTKACAQLGIAPSGPFSHFTRFFDHIRSVYPATESSVESQEQLLFEAFAHAMNLDEAQLLECLRRIQRMSTRLYR